MKINNFDIINNFQTYKTSTEEYTFDFPNITIYNNSGIVYLNYIITP